MMDAVSLRFLLETFECLSKQSFTKKNQPDRHFNFHSNDQSYEAENKDKKNKKMSLTAEKIRQRFKSRQHTHKQQESGRCSPARNHIKVGERIQASSIKKERLFLEGNKMTECKACKGTGVCRNCNGKGFITSHKLFVGASKCKVCDGNCKCPVCKGRGWK